MQWNLAQSRLLKQKLGPNPKSKGRTGQQQLQVALAALRVSSVSSIKRFYHCWFGVIEIGGFAIGHDAKFASLKLQTVVVVDAPQKICLKLPLTSARKFTVRRLWHHIPANGQHSGQQVHRRQLLARGKTVWLQSQPYRKSQNGSLMAQSPAVSQQLTSSFYLSESSKGTRKRRSTT